MDEKIVKALTEKGIVYAPMQGQHNILHCRANRGHGSLFYLEVDVDGKTLYRTIEVTSPFSGKTTIKRWDDWVYLSV